MDLRTFRDEGAQFVRRYEYDDVDMFAIDLGSVGAEATADIVDGTVIVVLEDGQDQPRQAEFELPEGEARAFIKNGVLTIEVER